MRVAIPLDSTTGRHEVCTCFLAWFPKGQCDMVGAGRPGEEAKGSRVVLKALAEHTPEGSEGLVCHGSADLLWPQTIVVFSSASARSRKVCVPMALMSGRSSSTQQEES